MSASLALDFGTSRTRLADEGGEILVDEPTVAAVETDTGRIVAFGDRAIGLGSTCGGRVRLIRPIRAGKLVDLELAESYLAAVLRAAGASRLLSPRLLVCAHLSATDVQRRAVGRALKRAGARSITFVEQPLAAAIGAGLRIEEPAGTMLVDVGGGVTDVAVIALGGIVTATSVEIGGDHLDEALRDHLARRHDFVVDLERAGVLRRRFGSLRARGPLPIEIAGRANQSGLPTALRIESEELSEVFAKAVRPIFDAAQHCIADAPPDLANDLLGAGVVLIGGGARIDGFAEQLAETTGLPVHVPDDGELLSVRGAARCLDGVERTPELSAARA